MFASGAETLGLKLSLLQIDQCYIYLSELMRWNQKINLTGLKDTKDIIVKNFLDSMVPVGRMRHDLGLNWMDVGSGGGFPGLVLKIVCPQLKMTLVEPTQKKVSFLHHVIGKLDLKNIFVRDTRIKSVAQNMTDADYDVVLSRALAPETVLKEGLSLVRKGGYFLFFQARFDEDWWMDLLEKYPILELKRPYRTQLPFLQDARSLVLVRVRKP